MDKKIKVSFKDLMNEYDMLETRKNDLGQEALLLAFAVSDKVKLLTIRCVHYQFGNFGINGFFVDGSEEFEDLFELDSKEDFTYDETKVVAESPLSEPDLKMVKELVQSELVEKFLEKKFGTNFTIKISLDEEKKLKMDFFDYNGDY